MELRPVSTRLSCSQGSLQPLTGQLGCTTHKSNEQQHLRDRIHTCSYEKSSYATPARSTVSHKRPMDQRLVSSEPFLQPRITTAFQLLAGRPECATRTRNQHDQMESRSWTYVVTNDCLPLSLMLHLCAVQFHTSALWIRGYYHTSLSCSQGSLWPFSRSARMCHSQAQQTRHVLDPARSDLWVTNDHLMQHLCSAQSCTSSLWTEVNVCQTLLQLRTTEAFHQACRDLSPALAMHASYWPCAIWPMSWLFVYCG